MGIELEPWWPELLAEKDNLSLRELATRFNTRPGAISAALKRTNTARTPKGDSLPPEPGEVSVNARPGSKDVLILPHLELLGKIPDSEVATRAGVSVRTIASFRSRNQIPGFKGRTKSTKPRRRRRSRIDPFADLVGRVPDRVVAEKASVSLNAVRNYRTTRGIPSARSANKREREPEEIVEIPTTTSPSVAVTAEEPVRSSARKSVRDLGNHAWRVVFQDGQSGIVTGANVLEASRRGVLADRGVVVSVQRLGEVIC